MTIIRLSKTLLKPIVFFGVVALFSPTYLFAQPANDNCANAVTLTSGGTTCNNTTGTVVNATVNVADPGSGSCTGTVGFDVWYKFTAQTTSPIITLSSVGANFLTAIPKIQILSGTCGSLTIFGCTTGLTYNPTGLTVGTTYYIRLFSTSGSAPASAGGFSICVTYANPNLCANAIYLPSNGNSCVNTAATTTGATWTAITTSCGSGVVDVWFSFTANSTNPTITTSGRTGLRLQVFTLASCGGTVTSMGCINAVSGTVTGLTIGSQYLIRVYQNSGGAGSFNICVTDPAPANDLCSAASPLTPGLTCGAPTTGTFYASTVSTPPTITGSCAGTVVNDVWYSFVASTAYATINMGSIGSNITNPGLELLSGSCSSPMYSLACGTTSLLASGLVPGNTYFVRAYSTGANPATSANSGFTICVTYTAPPPPPNDDCTGAINLPVNGSCNNVAGTVNSATASTGFPAGCASTPTAYDVWYKFTAVNTGISTTITTSSFGSGFGGTQRMQLFSGTCGSLTSMACGTTSITTTLLTQGTTYYVRIYTTTAPAPSINGGFNICVTSTSTPPRIGNSYVNITKNTVGGVVQNGDILEIRMTVLVGTGTLYKTRYLDSIPTNTSMVTATPIRIITNEGLAYKSYTTAADTDPATYKATGAGEYNVKLNLGLSTVAANQASAPLNNTSADATGAGNLPSTANPRGGGGLMFATSFRVQVTGSVGDTIKLNGGQFIYRTSAGGTDLTLPGTAYKILITDPLTLCSNSVGINNASEFGGTFGNGTNLNRSADLSSPIGGYTFVSASSSQAIGDGQYALVNNSSPISGTNNSANFANVCPTGVAPDLLCINRMFNGYWYIQGDHSGTSNSAGNTPAASGANGGYMLAVNADYVASEAYRQTLTGLCPNTYYEFSAWVQNICPRCGIDSTGAQFAGTVTAPTAGYPGVYPNLSFSLDGVDRYSTGQIDIGGWVKKGFVFKTDTAQTVTLSIRNNSQGGGGNDWVMDDISIATCFPSMSYSPTATPAVCSGNTIQIGDTVRSQFNNYEYYVWQRSQDGGTTWIDLTTPQHATPAPVSGQYEYITTLNVPVSNTTLADSGDIYRVYTATTVPNIINPNCVANDGSAPIFLSVLDCGIVLGTDLLSFNGNLMNNYSVLSWSTSKEDIPVHFELQRSDDNNLFNTIAIINGKNNGQRANYYSFTDPQMLSGKKWYRVIIIFNTGKIKYSQAIQLNTTVPDFEIENIINPFSSQLLFNMITKKSSKADFELVDMQGKVVKSGSYLIYAGTNSLTIPNTDVLSPGIYTLRIKTGNRAILKKVMKANN